MGKGKSVHPADAYRKEQKKKDAKRNAKTKANIKEVSSLLNNPLKIQDEINKVQKESDENRLDKGLKDRLKELMRMKEVADKKQLVKEALAGGPKRTNPTNIAASSAVPAVPSRRPEDSVHYHPQFNPTGAPPPGQPMMYKTPPVSAPADAPPQPMGQYGQPNWVSNRYSSAPVMANQIGFPIPPPRQQPVMGGVNSIPLPPPRQQPVMGGVNGIPLPPPMPPRSSMVPTNAFASQYNNDSASAQLPQNQRAPQAPRRQHARPSVDPLDPSASGYTHRYDPKQSMPSSPGKQQHNYQPERVPAVDSSMESLVPPRGHVDAIDSSPAGPPVAPDIMDTEDTSQENKTVGPMIPSEMKDSSHLPSAEEIMQRRFSVPAEESDEGSVDEVVSGEGGFSCGPQPSSFSDVGPVMISAEELMRRRHQISSDDNLDSSPAGPSFPGPAPGPSIGPEGFSGDDTTWDYYPTAEEALRSTGSEGLDSETSDRHSPKQSTTRNSALTMFSAYGDSDDDESSIEDIVVPLPTQKSVDRTRDEASGSETTKTSENHKSSDGLVLPNYPLPDSTIARVSSIHSASLGPKVVKVDSALTGFVPAAIKIKRQVPQTTKLNVLKKQKISHNGTKESNSEGITECVPAALSGSQSQTKATLEPKSIDSEYADFMKEIEALGDVES